MPFRHHLGTKTTAFDVLPEDLIVLEYQEGVSAGKVIATPLDGREATSAPQPLAVKGKTHAGYKAFAAQPGVLYEVEGVEWAPVVTRRFVTFNAEKGFVELTEQQARAIESGAARLPQLRGSENQVEWAEKIRSRAVAHVREAGRAELLQKIALVSSAAWFIARNSLGAAHWLTELTNLSASRRSSEEST